METEPTEEIKMDVDTEKAPEAPAPVEAVPSEALVPAPAGDDKAPPAAPAVHEDKAPDAVESADAATATAVKPPPTASSIIRPPPPPMDEAALAQYQRDIDVLREFDSIYEKVWNPTPNTYQYTLAEEDPQDDPSGNKYPAGIGATHRSMSARERETEHKRWQTALLARIPEQPTFEELGLANRVFFLGERRKRCLERENEQDDENEEPKTKKLKTDESKDENTSAKKDMEEEADVDEKKLKKEEKSGTKKESKEGDNDNSDEDKKAEKKGSDDDSSSDMFDDKSDDEEKADKKKVKDGSDSESSDMFDDKSDDEDEKKGKKGSDVTDDGDSGENKEEEGERKTIGGKTPLVPKLKTKDEEEEKKEEEEEKQEEPIKRIRPMSLAPVPSFHEQDLKRICMIHADLMGASMHEHARKRLQDVTKEYNNSKDSFDLVRIHENCQLAHTNIPILSFKHSAFRMSSLNVD
jgi:hypothetical protein